MKRLCGICKFMMGFLFGCFFKSTQKSVQCESLWSSLGPRCKNYITLPLTQYVWEVKIQHILFCAAAPWQLAIHILCEIPSAGQPTQLRIAWIQWLFKGWRSTLLYPSHTKSLMGSRHIFSAASRRDFLADDTNLWDLLVAEMNSKANLALMGMNYKASLQWVSFWL